MIDHQTGVGQGKPPWMRGQLGPGLRVLAGLAWVLLISGALVALIIAVVGLTQVEGTSDSSLTPAAGAIALLITIACIAGVWLLHPFISRPARFKPLYGQLPPDQLG